MSAQQIIIDPDCRTQLSAVGFDADGILVRGVTLEVPQEIGFANVAEEIRKLLACPKNEEKGVVEMVFTVTIASIEVD